MKNSMMKKGIVIEIRTALNHIENAYNVLKYNIENENSLSARERDVFYGYGVETAKLNLLRLVNAKKGLLSITGELKTVEG